MKNAKHLAIAAISMASIPMLASADGLSGAVSDPVVFPPPISLTPEQPTGPAHTTDLYNGLPLEEHSAARPIHVVSEPGNSYAVNGLPGLPDTNVSGTIIAYGEMKPAALLYGFTSDAPLGLPIFATMSDIDERGRPTLFDGATLRGSVQYSDEDASIVFNSARLKTGQEVPIQAIAVSGSTGNTGVAENVNRHVFQRYGSLFLAGLIEGFGQVGLTRLEESGEASTYVVTGDGSSITVESDAATDEEVLAAALEPVGSNLSSAAASNFNRPHTISGTAGMAFAIVFVESISAEDIK
jgi:hypothetical protein